MNYLNNRKPYFQSRKKLFNGLIFLVCLLLQSLPLNAGSNQKVGMPHPTRSCSYETRGKTSRLQITPTPSDLMPAGETGPVSFMFNFAKQLRSLARIPARYSTFHSSFEKIVLSYLERGNGLSRSYFHNWVHTPFLLAFPSCNYYVFALRKILI
jgi:hypothetical protein